VSVDLKSCGTCRHFNPDFAPDDNPHDALGLCEWPAANLPVSLKYGNRERGAVGPFEVAGCSCFEAAQAQIEPPKPFKGVISHWYRIGDRVHGIYRYIHGGPRGNFLELDHEVTTSAVVHLGESGHLALLEMRNSVYLLVDPVEVA
jgi:hypothetical protein